MKSFLFTLLVTLVSFTFIVSPAMAAKETTTILHCGCYYDSIDGASMLFHENDVSINSKGHRNHTTLSEDSCFTGLANEEPTFAPGTRDLGDCEITDNNDDIPQCNDEVEFDECGTIEAELPSCGNCLSTGHGTGCEVEACSSAIGALDPFCIDVEWDGLCVGQASDVCVDTYCSAP